MQDPVLWKIRKPGPEGTDDSAGEDTDDIADMEDMDDMDDMDLMEDMDADSEESLFSDEPALFSGDEE